MGIISRGFSGRRSAADAKLPPGQYLTTDFPVLSAGPTPHIPLDQWVFVEERQVGAGYYADAPGQTRLLGESRLPYLWGPMAGAALFGRRVMWRVGTVVALQDETATARTITLEVSDWPGHVAGQHVDVRLTASDGYSAARSYSIASAPNAEKRVELTVERLPNGEVSPYLTQGLAGGDRLQVRRPIGGWVVWRTQLTE